MKINDYIKLDSDKVYNNKEFKLYYSGYLTEVSNNNPISLRYGNEDWKNMQTVEMQKDENNMLFAKIKLNNFNKMNFCFEYNNVWDNNFSNNYSFDVSKFDLESHEKSEDEFEDYFSDDFLLAYNLNKKDKKAEDIPIVTAESEIFENASNINTTDTELQNLKESLDRLFPKENKKEVEIERFEEKLSNKFEASFSNDSLTSKEDFVAIKINNDELEIYTPKIPYRQTLLATVAYRNYEDQFISDIEIEDEKVILSSKFQYAEKLRKLTKEKELAQILRLSTEDEAQFLVVSPYSEVDMYDDSFFGTLKRYVAYISRSFKKVYYYLKENFSTDEIQ